MTRRAGFLQWIFPLMLGVAALSVLLSGRDLSQAFAELATGQEMTVHPLVAWAQRGVSIALLAISIERIFNHFYLRRRLPSALLSWVFVAYWFGTVAAPSLFGTHPLLAHDYVYTLILGFAGTLATFQELDKVLDGARNVLLAFLVAGVLLVPIDPQMVLDASYTQGLLPGVPRFGGLAPHPVAMGAFAQIFLLCLWCRPFSRRWLTLLGWIVGLGVLFFAQSKNAWIGFFLCSAALLLVRNGPGLWRRISDPRQGAFGVIVCLAVIVVAVGLTAWLLLGNAEEQAAGFLDTSEGAQLMTMTGRDRIWEIAIEEWQNNRMFGYGPSLWDDAFRMSIGMPNATSAHNQFMDTLARSGTVGATALVIYSIVLLVMSVRYARATGGLSLAVFLALALHSVSEVPLLLFGYGTEVFTHLLLIVTLAAAAGGQVEVIPAPHRPKTWGTPA